MTRPEILFLSHRIPYPPDKGDKIRSWAWLKHLAARYRVHLACFVDDPQDFAHQEFLSSICETVALIPLQPRWARIKSLTALSAGAPLTFAYFNSGKMKQAVDAARARSLAFEFVFSSAMAPFIENPVGSRKRIVDFCDADSAKWTQYASSAAFPTRSLYQREGRLLAQAEAAIAEWADLSFAVSEDEARVLNVSSRSERPVRSLPNGVDAVHFDPNQTETSADTISEVVFVGAMDYRANIEGVLNFIEKVWPKVRAMRSDARFAIVGSNPVPAILALDGKNGVSVTGRVRDVRPWLQGAKVVVAPLQVARGVQNKVLEAMSMAKPVVASSEAMTGIHAPPEAAATAGNPDAMTQAILALLDDPAAQNKIGVAARAFVVENFSWSASTKKLDSTLETLGLYSS